MRPSIFYFTNIAPHYRQEIWTKLIKDTSWKYTIVCGNSRSTNTIKSIDFETVGIEKRILQVRNLYFGKVIIWQVGAIYLALTRKMDIAILLGDMHILSNWLIAIICKIRKVKVLYWGHGFSGDERFFKKKLRVLFNRLADEHFLYGNRARSIMSALNFESKSLHVVYNSLLYDKQRNLRSCALEEPKMEIMHFFKKPNLPVITFIGRLTPIKKIDMFLSAVRELNSSKVIYNCLIIGDGSELGSLKNEFLNDKSRDFLHFYGSSYDEAENARLLTH